MTILIIHAHNENRGDEAAVKAMVDALNQAIPGCEIYISITGLVKYPNMPANVTQIDRFSNLRSHKYLLEFVTAYLTNGRVVFSKSGKEFFRVLRKADFVVHAPGGPSIGDLYLYSEVLNLLRLDMIRRMGKRYMFYAPSMGPFDSGRRRGIRRRVLKNAEMITLRDPISAAYVREFLPGVPVEQTLDSALQFDIDREENGKKLAQYTALRDFLDAHPKRMGITITDLKWHPTQRENPHIAAIQPAFSQFIQARVREGYGIVFIPQLYGNQTASRRMGEYMLPEHTFLVSDGSHMVEGRAVYDPENDTYDSYFQQYLIGQLDMVVGMRYHSNIFSAKMGTPFISVSYEQKMAGFMQTMGLEAYCLDVNDLSAAALEEKYEALCRQYPQVKAQLADLHGTMQARAHRTTEILTQILNS